MSIARAILLSACLLMAAAAQAQEAAQLPAAVSDAVYKGVVGKVLDAVPMDPNERVTLQRTGAVLSNTLTGRSLTAWAGFANPVLLIAGAIWGLISASNIKTADAHSTSARAAKTAARPGAPQRVAFVDTVEPVETAAAEQSQVALLAALPAVANGDESLARQRSDAVKP